MADNMTTSQYAAQRAKPKSYGMDLYKILSLNEGKKSSAYKDSLGNMSIAVGFNLEEPTNIKYLEERHGLTYDDLVNKGKTLNENQIRDLYNFNIKNALTDAKEFDPKFSSRPTNAKIALLDLSFNLGRKKLFTFKKMRKALAEDDYDKAAAEMKDSKWYDQVKTRGPRMVGVMKDPNNLTKLLNELRK